MDAATITNLFLVSLTLFLTAIILYYTVRASRASERSRQLQEEQASLAPNLRFPIREFDFTGQHPYVSFIRFEIANVGKTAVTKAHARVLFDTKRLEPTELRTFSPEELEEGAAAYDVLEQYGSIAVQQGGNEREGYTIDVHMLASDVPPKQKRTFLIPVAVHSKGSTELPYYLTCNEGFEGEGRTRTTISDVVQLDSGVDDAEKDAD